VPPSDFIPVLEQTGLILPVGAWVIDQACRQIKAWATLRGGPLQIAVNVASRQFAESDIDHIVGEALARHDVDGALLSLEVTESALMEDTVRAAATLVAVRARGVKVAIDDFGTGHSSLAYLKHFQVDTLKIDRAFVRDLVSDRGDAVLVDAILNLAHSLKIDVVAEGVETAEQLAYLARRRCDQIQGYYFSKPLQADQFERLVQADTRLAHCPGAAEPLQRTLLIVDDEPHVLAALERLFRQDGYKILTALGAAQGFHLLAQHQVQLILCDQRMGAMSGTEFFDKVKDMYPDTFRIILSGYTELSTIIEAINRGSLYRYFTKPWGNQELRDNIRAAFTHYWQQHGLPQYTSLPASVVH
jgi:EAL domain-containing protein (putative c-di-GMP-specific phosphodiesterase class I)/ActR/RegA family two-component response regulator